MSETVKPTPGPWTPDFGEAYRIKDRHGATLANVTFVNVQGRRDEIEVAANARLIAAAPDLLDALRTTAGNIRSLGPAGALMPFTEFREWLAVVDAAIAKAEGRTP